MSDPTADNKIADGINLAIKLAIQEVVDPLLINAAIASFPILGLPIIRQIFSYTVEFFGGYFYKYSAIAATQLVLDIQINQEKSQAGKAIDQLKSAIASGDQEAINAASKQFDDALSSLVHFNGSANP